MAKVWRVEVLPFLLSMHAAEPVLQVSGSMGSGASMPFSQKRGEVGFLMATGFHLAQGDQGR